MVENCRKPEGPEQLFSRLFHDMLMQQERREYPVKKLLIAESSSVFASALYKALEKDYRIQVCADGRRALELLADFRPDILIINLMLPDTDGLTVLQQTAFHPGIILAVTPYMCSYVGRSIVELGVDFTMIAPSVKALTFRLEDLIRTYSDTPDRRDLAAMTMHHLRLLNFSTHLDGYRQLCVALPLYAKDSQQLMTKELYPTVAKLCGSKDGRTVEHSIRNAICAAWEHRDMAIWRKYFRPGPSGKLSCPSNKEFICRLAEMLITGSGVL